jgi:hypothetical protein
VNSHSLASLASIRGPFFCAFCAFSPLFIFLSKSPGPIRRFIEPQTWFLTSNRIPKNKNDDES